LPDPAVPIVGLNAGPVISVIDGSIYVYVQYKAIFGYWKDGIWHTLTGYNEDTCFITGLGKQQGKLVVGAVKDYRNIAEGTENCGYWKSGVWNSLTPSSKGSFIANDMYYDGTDLIFSGFILRVNPATSLPAYIRGGRLKMLPVSDTVSSAFIYKTIP